MIPTLQEACTFAHDNKVALDLELKEEGNEEEIVRTALSSVSPERLLFTSFNRHSIRTIKETCWLVSTGLLLGRTGWRAIIADHLAAKRARTIGADVLLPHLDLLRFGLVQHLKATAIPIIVWTVNDNGALEELIHDPHIAGVITDNTELAKKVVASASTQTASSAS